MNRISILLTVCSFAVLGQNNADKVTQASRPRNLKVLSSDINVIRLMQSFNAGLGVQCSYCHDTNDFASDSNPKKEIARKMLMVIKQINMHFPDAGNDFANSRYLPFPEGKQYVTCYTCHQGKTKPDTQHPQPHARASEPYGLAVQGEGVPGAPAPPPGSVGASITPDGRVRR